MKLKQILLISIATLLIIVFLQNLQVVEYQFLFWFIALPKAVFAFLFMLTGIIIWLLMRKSFKKAKDTEEDSFDS